MHFKEPDVKYLRMRLHEGVVPIMDFDGLCDPFVAVNTGLMEWKSAIVKDTLTPQWDQEVVLGVYDLRQMDAWGLKLPEDMRSDTLRMTVYNYNPARDRRIGFINLKYADIPGYGTDDVVDPPAAHWFEADRHFGLLTMLVSSSAGKWVTLQLFDQKMKQKTKEQRSKIALIRALQTGLEDVKEKVAPTLEYAQDAVGTAVGAVAGYLPPLGPGVDGQALLRGEGGEEPSQEIRLQRKDRPPGEEPQQEDQDIDDAEAEAALQGAHEVCSIKAQVWFDNAYTPPPQPLVGELRLRLNFVELERRSFGAPRCPLVVLNYNRHWVRLPTVFGNVHAVFDQEFTFGVTEPAAVLTLAVFDDVADRLLGIEPRFMGLLRIRPCCLNGNRWHPATLPLYQRFKGNVRLRGRVALSCCLRLQSPIPIVAAMFKPPLKDIYYYRPLNEFKSDLQPEKIQDFALPIKAQQYDNLIAILKDMGTGPTGWHPSVIKKVSFRPTPELDLDLLNANFKRLMDCFKLVVRLIDYLDYVCLWTNWRESVVVNLTLVLLVCYIDWVPTALVLWMLVSFLRGMVTRARTCPMASMEAELFGEVVDGMDTDKADLSDEEDAPEKSAGKDDSEASAWEEIRSLIQMAIRVQETFGDLAAVVERIQSMPKFMDPRISGLLSIVFAVLVPGLCYIPLKLVVSFAVLFVLRHPALRDPIPPPPVNLVARLPSRAELLLPREGGSVMGF